MKPFLNIFFLTSLLGCAVSVRHPDKGESVFNGHRPTQQMSAALKDDLKECISFSEEMLVKSGLKIYRLRSSAIKDCLRRRGWEFSP